MDPDRLGPPARSQRRDRRHPRRGEGGVPASKGGARVASLEPIAGTRACSRTCGRARTCRMEQNPAVDALAALHRGQAELIEQIRRSQETVERSQELLRRIDDLLAKSPLKP